MFPTLMVMVRRGQMLNSCLVWASIDDGIEKCAGSDSETDTIQCLFGLVLLVVTLSVCV
jgi:hypothetical protein